MMNNALALVDCNNFFVSCERLFRPELDRQPVVVLSSNDGCVISRSNEAKDLGIPMGAPMFKYLPLFKQHDVVTFSANFELYGDVSDRITNLLTSITPHIEVYSVDESFLDLSELAIDDYDRWGREVRASIFKHTGMPVSIGITTSKTLSKLAGDRAKKQPELNGALSFVGKEREYIDQYLARTPVRDIWGVGWKLAPRLKAEGIHTAYDLARLRPQRAQQLMGIHGRQMVAELNGTACHLLEKHRKPQKMIMRGRQFGEDTGQFHVIESAVTSMTTRAASHLRRERQLAQRALVVIRTNRHKPGFRIRSQEVRFAVPTADTGYICRRLVEALETIHNPHELYHKADVMLYDLIPEHSLQTDIFDVTQAAPARHDASQARMAVIDQLNERYGKTTVRYAAEDLSQLWRPRYRLGSPRYTSSWRELPVAKAVY